MGKLSFLKTGGAKNNHRYRSPADILQICIFSAVCILLSHQTLFGQVSLLEQTITLPRQKTTLYEALNLISQHAGCRFIYNSEYVRSDKRVKLQAEGQPMYKVLDNILANPDLSYKVIGNHILIYIAREAPPEKRVQPPVPGPEQMNTVVIRGHIFDNENSAVIPYATIGIVEENIGTIANSDGFFLLKIPDSLIGTSLVVSHLGYESQRIPIQLLGEQQVDIRLDRRVISIQEVIIRYIDPEVIINKAMDQRKVNYAAKPAYLTAFYREGVKKNHDYASYSEAVFRIYKAPYDALGHADQVKLLKSRKIRDPDITDTVFLKLKAGVLSALQLDIVKHVPGFLDLVPPIEYTYGYSNLVSYNDKNAYAIGFVQNKEVDKALYTGTVYIEKEGFAILGAEFVINPAHLGQAVDDFVLRKSPKLIVKLKKISYSVSYKSYNGRYYLNHARCDLEITTRLRHHLVSDHFDTFLEFATCAIDTCGVVKFPRHELVKPGAVFSDLPYRNDDDFWGSFNIIAPEAKLGEALSGIMGKIAKID